MSELLGIVLYMYLQDQYYLALNQQTSRAIMIIYYIKATLK